MKFPPVSAWMTGKDARAAAVVDPARKNLRRIVASALSISLLTVRTGGRPKEVGHVKELARQHTPEAIHAVPL
jgi:hypothetical protein